MDGLTPAPVDDTAAGASRVVEVPAELAAAIRAGWSLATCDPVDRLRWSPATPSRGQCGATALVVQDHLGGELLLAEVTHADGRRQGVHYFNLVDGVELDLTRDQFSAGERIASPKIAERPDDLTRSRLYSQYRSLAAAVARRLGCAL